MGRKLNPGWWSEHVKPELEKMDLNKDGKLSWEEIHERYVKMGLKGIAHVIVSLSHKE